MTQNSEQGAGAAETSAPIAIEVEGLAKRYGDFEAVRGIWPSGSTVTKGYRRRS